jgi:hypothetical protein
VFILLGIGAGLLVGLVLGGSLERLRTLSFRLVPLALAALIAQVVLFADPVATAVADAVGRLVYTISTAAVFIAVLANLRIIGVPIVALGAGLNLLAIAANGGIMPAEPGAAAAAGIVTGDQFSNSAIVTDPVLAPITDIFAIPAGLPFANVFSIGDVLIAIGLAWTVAAAMTRRDRPREPTAPA